MTEICLELSASFEITAEDACAGQAAVATLALYEGVYALAPYIEPEPERVGMYVIQDDLPSPEEMEDDEECKLFIASSHKI